MSLRGAQRRGNLKQTTLLGSGSRKPLQARLFTPHGRQLTSITTGGKTTTYAYDADGIRTEKVVGGVTHHYVTRGGKLMRESFLSGSAEIIMDFGYRRFTQRFDPACQ